MWALFCYVSNELLLHNPSHYVPSWTANSHYMYTSVSNGILQSQTYHFTSQTKNPDIECTFLLLM